MSRLENYLVRPNSPTLSPETANVHVQQQISSLSPTSVEKQVASIVPSSYVREPQGASSSSLLKRQSGATTSDRPAIRRKRANTDQEDLGRSPQDRALASLDLGRYFRQLHTRPNRSFDSQRQVVLETAIKVAKETFCDPIQEQVSEIQQNFYDSSAYPSVELLHFMQQECQKNLATSYFVGHFGGFRYEALETMLFSLLDHTVHGQQRLRYIICVNYAAFAFMMALQTEQSDALRRKLLQSKDRYSRNVFYALQQLSTTPEPDVSLFYAAQSGALLAQDKGYMRRCWKLNNLACQVAAALRGRSMAELGLSDIQDLVYLRQAFIKAFVFDTTLSANIYQPACLKVLDRDRSILDTTRPADAMLGIMLSLAEVQEVIILETRKCVAPESMSSMDMERIGSLRKEMDLIRRQVADFRATPPWNEDQFLQFEASCMELVFFSMMTTINRLVAVANEPAPVTQCLENARKCLLTVQQVLRVMAASQDTEQDRYRASLAWIIPLYSLRPLYFVFSHIIESSDVLDIKILQDVTEALVDLSQDLPSVGKVLELCRSFLGLHAEYSDQTRPSSNSQSFDSGAAYQLQRAEGTMTMDPQVPRPRTPFSPQTSHTLVSPEITGAPATSDVLLDQNIDWELFCFQPLTE